MFFFLISLDSCKNDYCNRRHLDNRDRNDDDDDGDGNENGKKAIGLDRKNNSFANFFPVTWKYLIETLRSRFLGIFREPRTSKSHVIRALLSGLRFEVHVCTARPRSRGKWYTAKFFDYRISNSISKKSNFENNFSAKIVVSGWKKQTWSPHATTRESQIPNMGRRVPWNR